MISTPRFPQAPAARLLETLDRELELLDARQAELDRLSAAIVARDDAAMEKLLAAMEQAGRRHRPIVRFSKLAPSWRRRSAAPRHAPSFRNSPPISTPSMHSRSTIAAALWPSRCCASSASTWRCPCCFMSARKSTA